MNPRKSPAFNKTRTQAAANQAAATASLAWLTASGLATEIEALRWAADSTPIPAPGLEAALDEARRAAMDSTSGTDRIFTLLEQQLDTDTVAAVRRALAEAQQRCADTQLWTRRLAQLCLGVTTFLASSGATALAERAAVIVLVAPSGGRRTLPADGLYTTARNFETFRVELAGMLCRLIFEHDWTIDLSVAVASEPTISVLLAFCPAGRLELSSDNPSVPSKTWIDPVVVVEPVAYIIEQLRRLTVGSPDPLDLITIRLNEPTLRS